jgi:hypothetical protein
MRPKQRAMSILATLLATAVLLAACASPGTVPSQSPASPAASPPASPSATATHKPTPSVVPTPAPVAAWTKPKLVTNAACISVRGGIDTAGRTHFVASCLDGLRYGATKSDGSWSTTKFSTPENRLEQDPQLAFWGSTAFVAYSRLAVGPGFCGDDGLTDTGVFYRQRTLPSGAWSKPKRLGRTDDEVRAFRVDGSTIHALVQPNRDGKTAYLVSKGTISQRFAIPKITGSASLRIGSDGLARVAYESAGSIRLATFDGSAFSSVKIPSVAAHSPVLVLDSRDQAHVMWVRDARGHDAGCVDGGEPDPNRGIYYATNASGGWHTERMTRETGEVAFQVDATTREIRAVLSSSAGLVYYAKQAGGWSHKKLAPGGSSSPVILANATTGGIVVMYIRDAGSKSGIYMMSKG